jgi:hypothetical protein
MVGNNFNKFLGFLVLGLICIIGIGVLDVANITDNKQGQKTMIYIILSLTSSFFLYYARQNYKIYRLYNTRKVYVSNSNDFADISKDAMLKELEKNEYVLEYKNMLKRLQPECYIKPKE